MFLNIFFVYVKCRLVTETSITTLLINLRREAPRLINNVVIEVEVTDLLSSLSQRLHTECCSVVLFHLGDKQRSYRG